MPVLHLYSVDTFILGGYGSPQRADFMPVLHPMAPFSGHVTRRNVTFLMFILFLKYATRSFSHVPRVHSVDKYISEVMEGI